MRIILLTTVVMLFVTPVTPTLAQQELRLPGGGELVFEGFQFPALDAAGKARVRELKSMAITPSPLLTDTTVITELVNTVRQRTGLQVFTPSDFTRAAMEVGEPAALQAGLTEDEQNRVARRVGQRLGAGAVLVIGLTDRGTRFFSDFLGLNQGYVQSSTLRARLVPTQSEGIYWNQAMNYRLTWRITAGTAISGSIPAYPNQVEVTLAVMLRMVERFLADAWNP